MNTPAIQDLLKARFGNAVQAIADVKDAPVIRVVPSSLADVCRTLKETPELAFDFLECLSGTDHGAELGVTVHLYSHVHRHKLTVETRVPKEKPEVPTLDAIWAGANWHEREAFDLLGIVFTGSRDLRRILLPDGWIGHPLRKDYRPPDAFQGIPLQ